MFHSLFEFVFVSSEVFSVFCVGAFLPAARTNLCLSVLGLFCDFCVLSVCQSVTVWVGLGTSQWCGSWMIVHSPPSCKRKSSDANTIDGRVTAPLEQAQDCERAPRSMRIPRNQWRTKNQPRSDNGYGILNLISELHDPVDL